MASVSQITVDNQGFSAFRTAMNNSLNALNTLSSASSAPGSKAAGSLWLDTTSAATPTLKFYDGSDWISLCTFDYSANTVNWLDSTVSLGADSVDSDQYVDGSIDRVHLAADIIDGTKIDDDVIDSEHYVAASIDNEHLADDAVGLAEMASGTDGNIISYDASGDPVAIATGTDGQVLTSAGAGAPPAFEDASGGANTPAFEAYLSATQAITHDTLTKITLSGETHDTDGCYDNSTNYRFTPDVAGKYFTYGSITANATTEQLKRFSLYIYKNGSIYKYHSNYFTNNEAYISHIYTGAVIAMNGSSDYVELYIKLEYESTGGLQVTGGNSESFFGAYKIIE